ncbi:MAG: CDGSH iron-sulfur domain-containing protein [Candidatus Goldbacteria bacterium]|nr:CDGSH iron-sulfur domain-containing protein [Candidatus Goldiibacteriota bacterium]
MKKIKVCKDGPYLVTGSVPLDKTVAEIGESDEPEFWIKKEDYKTGETYSLCRCGHTKTPPFCDGSHTAKKFNGKETAGFETFEELAKTYKGPDLDLKDAEVFCASARFCHPKGGTWHLTKKSNDPDSKKIAIEQACNCSAGRLVAYDKKTGKPIEPDFKPHISATEDPQVDASGPLWVKGGIPIESAEGKTYEIRNRVTLCRCGKSKNKPFCDGRHIK